MRYCQNIHGVFSFIYQIEICAIQLRECDIFKVITNLVAQINHLVFIFCFFNFNNILSGFGNRVFSLIHTFCQQNCSRRARYSSSVATSSRFLYQLYLKNLLTSINFNSNEVIGHLLLFLMPIPRKSIFCSFTLYIIQLIDSGAL